MPLPYNSTSTTVSPFSCSPSRANQYIRNGLVLAMVYLKASCNQHQKERFEFPPEIRGSSKAAISFGSCNDLVLLVGCHENLILWNPYTRECRETVYPHSTKYRYNTRIYGLGYDSNDDYKLGVIFFTGGTPHFYVIYAFSLKTNRWKKIFSYPYWAFGVKVAAATVVNGALHRLMVVYDNRKFFIGFDLVTENLKELSLPTYLEMRDDDVD